MTTALQALRNLSFVGHPSSGKTTLVDALAHLAGASPRKGSVAEKTSICDTEPEEQDKQHTLELAVVHAEHDGCSWTFMDTPGYPEFLGDVRAAMWASELVCGVVSCGSGVTFNLRTKLGIAGEMGRGRALIVTHVDGENADFDNLVLELRSLVGEICVPYLLPDGSGANFSKVSTIIENEVADWKKRLMDRVMDACEDEELLNSYLETEALTDDQLHEMLPAAIAQGTLIPILACNPDSGVGVPEVLSFLKEYAPHPGCYGHEDRDGNEIALDPEGSVVGAVFNVKSDPHVGKVCIAKMLRGTLHASDPIFSKPDGEKGSKPGGLFHPVGAKRETIDTAKPGEIISFSKIDSAGYGDGVSTSADGTLRPMVPLAPVPMVIRSIVPKSRADEQKIGEALNKLSAEDVGFETHYDAETHELLVHGMSELHLQVVEARLKRRFGVEVEIGIPRISYRETIQKPAEGHHRHKKQSGGRGQFGECFIRMKPLGKGEGLQFKDAVVGGAIPRNLIPAVEKGIREQAEGGILTGSPVVDIEVELYDGKFHAVDSDEASFKAAGSRAFIDGFNKAKPALLEPVMEMIISVPTDHAGTIFSDITSQRRGHVLDQTSEADGALTIIKAHVPLSTVQTYQRDLKSQTAGEGSYTMAFHDYAPMPAAEQSKAIAEAGQKHDHD